MWMLFIVPEVHEVFHSPCSYSSCDNKSKWKDEILPSATIWLDLENIMLSEVSLMEKVKHGFIHMWDIKEKTAIKQAKWIKPHRHKQQYGNYQRQWEVGGGGRREWREPNIWWWKETWLWVANTQCNIQTIYNRITHLKLIQCY